MTHLLAFLSGSLFAVGLAVGGMTQPTKVFAFLDFSGRWDPSLAFVMGGALVVYTLLFRVIMKRPAPLLADRFKVPTRRDITPRLLFGSSLFGIGWSIAGFCPGPALTSLGAGMHQAVLFVPMMALGMVLARAAETGLAQRASDKSGSLPRFGSFGQQSGLMRVAGRRILVILALLLLPAQGLAQVPVLLPSGEFEDLWQAPLAAVNMVCGFQGVAQAGAWVLDPNAPGPTDGEKGLKTRDGMEPVDGVEAGDWMNSGDGLAS